MNARRQFALLGLLALVAGLLAYGLTRWVFPASLPAADTVNLDWLRQEFALTPAQLETVASLHADYAPVCAGHCAAIAEAETALAASTTPDARISAQAELKRLEQRCADSTRAHLRAVAAAMPPAQAARFLALIEPKIAHTEGRIGAPDLNARP